MVIPPQASVIAGMTLETIQPTDSTAKGTVWLDPHTAVRCVASWIGLTWHLDDEAFHKREMLVAMTLSRAFWQRAFGPLSCWQLLFSIPQTSPS